MEQLLCLEQKSTFPAMADTAQVKSQCDPHRESKLALGVVTWYLWIILGALLWPELVWNCGKMIHSLMRFHWSSTQLVAFSTLALSSVYTLTIITFTGGGASMEGPQLFQWLWSIAWTIPLDSHFLKIFAWILWTALLCCLHHFCNFF